MKSDKQVVDRREALARLGMVLGGVISAPVAGAILSGCGSPSPKAWRPETLTDDQNRLVVMLSELIIPETDTPGAAAANVNVFIDRILTDWYSPDESEIFLEGLGAVESMAVAGFGNSFLSLETTDQIGILEQLQPSESDEPTTAPPFFSMLKELTLVGYYTSEIGATEELRYLAVPVTYDGCIPFEKVGRTWA